MSENGNKPQVPSATLTLTITFDQMSGAVNVQGPVENALVCYGMLEAAKDAVRYHAMQRAQGQRILPASAVPFLKQ